MKRTPLQHARRAALADASIGDGHDEDPSEPLQLYVHVPLTEPQPCPACQAPCEPGIDHGCRGPRPEATR